MCVGLLLTKHFPKGITPLHCNNIVCSVASQNSKDLLWMILLVAANMAGRTFSVSMSWWLYLFWAVWQSTRVLSYEGYKFLTPLPSSSYLSRSSVMSLSKIRSDTHLCVFTSTLEPPPTWIFDQVKPVLAWVLFSVIRCLFFQLNVIPSTLVWKYKTKIKKFRDKARIPCITSTIVLVRSH